MGCVHKGGEMRLVANPRICVFEQNSNSNVQIPDKNDIHYIKGQDKEETKTRRHLIPTRRKDI